MRVPCFFFFFINNLNVCGFFFQPYHECLGSVEYSHGLYAQSVYFVSEKLEVYVNASSTDYLGFIILRVLFLFTYLFALIQ